MPKYKTVEVPVGAFIGWGKQGQEVEIQVFTFSETDGHDFNGNSCPRVVGTLQADCDNYRDLKSNPPTHETLKAGEMVTIDGATANLKKALLLASPKSKDFMRFTFSDTYKNDKGEGKVITVEHAEYDPADDTSGVSEDDI